MAEPPTIEKADVPTRKPHESNKITFFIFLSAIFLSSIYFSLIHVSPSTLFKDTNFWFLLSNAIILIVAADSGAFSSTNHTSDLYEEYSKHARLRNNTSYEIQSPENRQKISTNGAPRRETSVETSTEERHYHRSKSENAIVAVEDESKKVLHRSQTEKDDRRSEDSEFSGMSDEELNRRVEEFIKRFNREIRLQQIREDNK